MAHEGQDHTCTRSVAAKKKKKQRLGPSGAGSVFGYGDATPSSLRPPSHHPTAPKPPPPPCALTRNSPVTKGSHPTRKPFPPPAQGPVGGGGGGGAILADPPPSPTSGNLSSGKKNEIYQRAPNLEVHFRSTNFLPPPPPPPPGCSINQQRPGGGTALAQCGTVPPPAGGRYGRGCPTSPASGGMRTPCPRGTRRYSHGRPPPPPGRP